MQRIEKVREVLKQKNLGAILVSSPSNIAYLLKYFGFSHHEQDAFLLVGKKSIYLITNPLYSNAFSKNREFELLITNSENRFPTLLEKIVKKEKIVRLGIEEENISIKEFRGIKKSGARIIPADLSNIKEIKSTDEIEKIKKACAISDKALENIKSGIKPGITEIKLAKLLEEEIRKLDADIAFETIVAFGANSATPHHKTGDQKSKANDTVLIDFGAKFDNYCADITRTFFIGIPTTEQKRVYKTVLESQQKAIEYLKSKIKNIKASTVDKAARDYIVKNGYPSIPHSLGHGIGLEVHESPSISPLSEEKLTEGMVFSIEPGVYFPGKFGIRIEDLFTLQGGKLIRLTNSPSTLQSF